MTSHTTSWTSCFFCYNYLKNEKVCDILLYIFHKNKYVRQKNSKKLKILLKSYYFFNPATIWSWIAITKMFNNNKFFSFKIKQYVVRYKSQIQTGLFAKRKAILVAKCFHHVSNTVSWFFKDRSAVAKLFENSAQIDKHEELEVT